MAATDEVALRVELGRRLTAARARSDALFEWLAPAAWLTRPIAERHRLVFYLGHLEAFDWNLLVRDVAGRPSRHPAFEALFAFGIDPVDGQLPADTEADWPALGEVRAWARALRPDVDEVLAHAPFCGWLEGGGAALRAIEHRLMHVETLAYLLAQLPAGLKAAGPPPTSTPSRGAVPPRWVHYAPARVALGLSRAAAPYEGWCNEYEGHEVEVPAFELAARKTTNGDWLVFVEAGGYAARRWWTEPGWDFREAQRLAAPTFWVRRDGGWHWRAMFGEVPLPLDWPVYVSHAEAEAYARWRGARLPTEAEWHRAVHAGGRRYAWGDEAPRPGHHGNFGFARVDPTPVGAHPAGATPEGLDEPVGNGWEWTSTPFAPWPGFAPLPYYPGYSAPFFDGKHFVMAGASASTDVTFLRPSFRNWFQPHYPYVFATVRLAGAA